jgi:serpin B
MADTLHFELTPERLHPAMGALLADLKTPAGQAGFQLHIANALWPQKGHDFLPEFFKLAQTHYDAGLEALDYAGATESARQTINTWVEQHTAEKIKDLIPQGVLSGATTLVLTNAVYFKGDWTRQFDAKLTRDGPFTLADGKQVNVPLMSQTGRFGYMEEGDLQVLELPYSGDALSMVVFLPRANDGLPKVEEALKPAMLTHALEALRIQEVHVMLPRFQATLTLSLKKTLHDMGMRDAFSGEADFSGMTGRRDLWIDAVLHKAYVDVNEEGTEAAAATAIAMMRSSAVQQPTPVFRADHPFVFLIRDTRSGSILFMGRILKPE